MIAKFWRIRKSYEYSRVVVLLKFKQPKDSITHKICFDTRDNISMKPSSSMLFYSDSPRFQNSDSYLNYCRLQNILSANPNSIIMHIILSRGCDGKNILVAYMNLMESLSTSLIDFSTTLH